MQALKGQPGLLGPFDILRSKHTTNSWILARMKQCDVSHYHSVSMTSVRTEGYAFSWLKNKV